MSAPLQNVRSGRPLRRRKSTAKRVTPIKKDKYAMYEEAVQDPVDDVKFFAAVFKEIHGVEGRSFREDFCGTFRLSCEWVKLHPENRAIGVDIDDTPLEYGRSHHLRKLQPGQRRRITLLQDNVLAVQRPRVDFIGACNFSYFIFKKRKELKRYFRSTFESLKARSLFIVDTTGGSDCYEANMEWRFLKSRTGRHKFTYFWDQKNFNPITNESEFAIHFKLPDGTRLQEAFHYDWRLWSIPELREVMEEAGFSKTYVYWEGNDNSTGGGDGIFTRSETGEACPSWIAYVVGVKG